MDHSRTILRQRLRRRHRVRRHIRGTTERPRLAVFRTHKHIYAQIIDDSVGRTLISASSMDKQIRDAVASSVTTAAWPPLPMRPVRQASNSDPG